MCHFAFFLRNSFCSNLPQGRACPLTHPTSPTRPGTNQVKAHPCQCTQSPLILSVPVCLLLHPYSHSCDVKQPGLSQCCSNLVRQGIEPLNWLSPKNLAADLEGAGAWGCCCPGPRAGPRDLIVLKHSPYCLIFQCPLQFLVSYLPICWGTVSCSLCSSVDLLGVSPVCSGKWNLLPPISPPS